MVTGTELTSHEQAESNGQRTNGGASAKLWVAAGVAGMVILGAWLKYSPSASRWYRTLTHGWVSLVNFRQYRKSSCARR